MTARSAIESKDIIKFTPQHSRVVQDQLTVEEPLEIRLGFYQNQELVQERISVTMRTPGNDFELAVGFLFTEGLIQRYQDIQSIRYCQTEKAENRGNVVRVQLKPGIVFDHQKLQRNFYMTSSCGICGKASIEAVQIPMTVKEAPLGKPAIDLNQLYELTETLRREQKIFKSTGSIHAAGLFNLAGELLLLYEDIGRHNAVDKLLGAALINGWLPLQQYCIIISGRAGFELVQKSVMAGLSVMGAVGAPSNLAVQLAEKHHLALIGFIKEKGANIYTGNFTHLIDPS